MFDIVVEMRGKQKRHQQELDGLKPLPEAYISTDDFRSKLAEARRGYENEVGRADELGRRYREAERLLPETSYKDLTAEQEAAEKQFQRNVEHDRRLIKIIEAFEETRARVDENSFTPVLRLFSEYINMLTQGNSPEMSDSLEIDISNGELMMPVDLPSTGTYGSVSLALRLTLLEYILGDGQGFLILDDCLVDLDSGRKEDAMKLIREFAEKHQVIFSTCNSETPRQLDRRIIEM